MRHLARGFGFKVCTIDHGTTVLQGSSDLFC